MSTTAAETKPKLRLVIEGDEGLMQQVIDAIDLQGRLHLGQFDVIPGEIIRTFDLNTLYRARVDPSAENQRLAALGYFEGLRARMNAEERAWQEMRGALRQNSNERTGSLFGPMVWMEREARAYSLWKLLRKQLAEQTGARQELGSDYYGGAAESMTVTMERTEKVAEDTVTDADVELNYFAAQAALDRSMGIDTLTKGL